MTVAAFPFPATPRPAPPKLYPRATPRTPAWLLNPRTGLRTRRIAYRPPPLRFWMSRLRSAPPRRVSPLCSVKPRARVHAPPRARVSRNRTPPSNARGRPGARFRAPTTPRRFVPPPASQTRLRLAPQPRGPHPTARPPRVTNPSPCPPRKPPRTYPRVPAAWRAPTRASPPTRAPPRPRVATTRRLARRAKSTRRRVPRLFSAPHPTPLAARPPRQPRRALSLPPPLPRRRPRPPRVARLFAPRFPAFPEAARFARRFAVALHL
mmetsp:Transcript_718/g.2718  ORF Transcript_718/g.2718 Transcript_718/m.2718 type:complete len:265 (-) Transcript_718:875-1669(-)